MILQQDTLDAIAAEMKRIASGTFIPGLTGISMSLNDGDNVVCFSGTRPGPSYEFMCFHAPSISEAIEGLRKKAGNIDTEIAELETKLSALKAVRVATPAQ